MCIHVIQFPHSIIVAFKKCVFKCTNIDQIKLSVVLCSHCSPRMYMIEPQACEKCAAIRRACRMCCIQCIPQGMCLESTLYANQGLNMHGSIGSSTTVIVVCGVQHPASTPFSPTPTNDSLRTLDLNHVSRI